MDSSFRSSRFDKLIVECGRLIASAGDHERALGALVEQLEHVLPEPTAHDLLTTVRRLRTSAQNQRQRAEALHAGLIGDSTIQSSSGKPIVLVVDDSKDSVETVALFLELSGFQVVTASNGLEALIAAHYARPDVAVLDVAMPVMNGLEAARLLKASPVTQSTRLLAYTANWSLEDAALKDAFTDVLAKPANAERFLATVQNLAAGGESRLS
jgi:CheY-like chemotaxis protein